MHALLTLSAGAVADRAAALLAAHQRTVHERTSRHFAVLMALQWVAGVAAALWLSPLTWAGSSNATHPHVWAAVVIGAAVSFLPIYLALTRPADAATRHVVAVGQMLTSSLLIHLTGGRIETHFHIFGSLAFLAFYRDWRVLVSASAVVALDHVARGVVWPQSVYGVTSIEPWRWLEHAGWVVFEDVFLAVSIREALKQAGLVADRQAELEAVNASIERQVLERTAELRRESGFVSLLQRIAAAANEAESVDDALRTALAHVCASTGASVGHVRLAARDGSVTLAGSSIWHGAGEARFAGLVRASETLRIAAGEGLAGRVLATGAPAWAADLGADASEAHAAAAAEAGLSSGFALPVLVGSEVVAVLEFFAEAGAGVEADDKLRDVLGNIGAQVGRVIERQRAHDELAAFTAKIERSNRELQDFAYVASHDLQEPLRKIQAFGDRLRARCGEALGDQGRDYLDRMQNAAKRMSTLISDLLAFSRVTTKAEPFRAVELPRVASEVLGDLEVRIEQSGATVEVGELPTIDADPVQMRQLLQNLVGNGLKFHRPGDRPVVRISAGPAPERRARPGAPDADFCEIRVEDRGIGFDSKYLDRIFNVFQRLHGRGEYEGTGIGLAICRKIVERHGGSITAESAPGEGATFRVTLPVRQPEGVS